MFQNPLELEILVEAYATDRDAKRQTKRLLRQALAGNGDDAGLTSFRRATGCRLIALGEWLAGGRDRRVDSSGASLRPARTVAH